MATSARFGFIPLPLSLQNNAVKGEFLVDPNTGHIYLKKADGTVYSKTLELENKLNDLILNQAYFRNDISFSGSEINRFASKKDVTPNDDLSGTPQTDAVKLDLLTLNLSPLYKYRAVIKFRFNGIDTHPKAFINYKSLSGDIAKDKGHPINHQTPYSTERELLIFEFPRLYTEANRSNAYISFEAVAKKKIEYIAIQKVPFLSGTRNYLLISGDDIGNDHFLKQGKIVDKSVTVSAQTTEVLKVFGVEKNNPLTFNMRCADLIPGAYSVNITLMKPRAPLTITISPAGSEVTQTKTIPVTSMPTIGGQQGALYSATTTIFIPLAGLANFKISCTAEEDTEIISVAFQQIHTATYDHATL